MEVSLPLKSIRIKEIEPNPQKQFIVSEIEVVKNSIDQNSIKSFCFFLGPHRNLSSLSVLFLAMHPNVQALNHGHEVLFPQSSQGDFTDKELPENLRWMKCYSQAGFSQFVQQIIEFSCVTDSGGYGSPFGPSCHAAKGNNISIENDETVADNIECVAWKEGKRLGNIIRTAKVEMGYILASNPKLRFLMPVRNIINCAHSNRKSHYLPFLEFDGRQPTIEETIVSIIEEIGWFMRLKKANPGRFFYILEGAFDRSVLIRLAGFLGLKPDEQWISRSLDGWKIRKGGYQYNEKLVSLCYEKLKAVLWDQPELLEKFEAVGVCE